MSGLMETIKSKQFIIISLAGASSLYLLNSFYNYIYSYFKNKSLKREITEIIDKYRYLIEDHKHLTKTENCFLIYYIVLNNLYKKQLIDFINRRRKFLNDLEQYISVVKKHTNEFKFIEENILQIVYSELQEDGEADNESPCNVNEIKRIYYLKLDIPVNIPSAQLVEIINVLHQKTKIYISELQDHMNYKNDYVDEKIQMLAEYRAFDYIQVNYNFEREEIEKGMIEYNLTIQEI